MKKRTLEQRAALNTLYNYIRKEGKFKLMGRKARNKNIKIVDICNEEYIGISITDIDNSNYTYYFENNNDQLFKRVLIFNKKEKYFEYNGTELINKYDFIPARLTKKEKIVNQSKSIGSFFDLDDCDVVYTGIKDDEVYEMSAEEFFEV